MRGNGCVLVLLGSVLVAGCGVGAPQIEDLDRTLEEIVRGQRDFHIANEIYYAEHQRYTADLDELQEYAAFRRDSIELDVQVTADGQGMSSIGTHQRVGPDAGCVFVWGSAPSRATPGGRMHDGENHFVCDEAFDGHTTQLSVADPPG